MQRRVFGGGAFHFGKPLGQLIERADHRNKRSLTVPLSRRLACTNKLLADDNNALPNGLA